MELEGLDRIIRLLKARKDLFGGAAADLGATDRALREIADELATVPPDLADLGLVASSGDNPAEWSDCPRLSQRADLALSHDGFTKETLAVLEKVAAALDRLAQPPHNLLGFVPDQWVPLPDGSLLIDWPGLALLQRSSPGGGLTQAQRRHKQHFHRLLSRGQRDTDVDCGAAMRHSFARFLLAGLPLPHRADIGTLVGHLSHLRTLVPWLPPALPSLLHEALSAPLGVPVKDPCSSLLRAIAAEMSTALVTSDKARAPGPHLAHRIGGYSVPGLGKDGPNEDRELVADGGSGIPTFVGVADGVSNCDLGSGATAADVARTTFEGRGARLPDVLTQEQVSPGWVTAARGWLQESLDEVQVAIVASTNAVLRAGEGTRPNDPMACTVVASLVRGDTAVVGWVGDAIALRYSAATGRLFRLTVPQDTHTDLLRKGDLALSALSDAPRIRTHALGGGVWNAEENCFDLVSADPDFDVFAFEEGDVMVLGSDGLLDCMEGQDEFDRLARLASTIEAETTKNSSARRIAAALVRLGESELSNDNITARVVLFEQAPTPSTPQTQRAKKGTSCPKKSS